jgi:PPOX class probable F420-dependent enzyme
VHVRTWHAGAVFSAWELALLEELQVGRLGTIAPDGRPHLVPVCYALLGEAIVIAIDEKPKSGARLARIRNIERDARVTFLADRYSDEWEALAWVRIDGHATIAPQGSAQPEALEALRRRYPRYRTMALEALPLITIEAERVVSWRWTGGDGVAGR